MVKVQFRQKDTGLEHGNYKLIFIDNIKFKFYSPLVHVTLTEK